MSLLLLLLLFRLQRSASLFFFYFVLSTETEPEKKNQRLRKNFFFFFFLVRHFLSYQTDLSISLPRPTKKRGRRRSSGSRLLELRYVCPCVERDRATYSSGSAAAQSTPEAPPVSPLPTTTATHRCQEQEQHLKRFPVVDNFIIIIILAFFFIYPPWR